jgi:3'-phosphoadenosine 5'-phosphosulfate sulfotransferase (PAPS reductase)/FAD synthetase
MTNTTNKATVLDHLDTASATLRARVRKALRDHGLANVLDGLDDLDASERAMVRKAVRAVTAEQPERTWVVTFSGGRTEVVKATNATKAFDAARRQFKLTPIAVG